LDGWKQNIRKKTMQSLDFKSTIGVVIGGDRSSKRSYEFGFGLLPSLRRHTVLLGRLALFVVYFWFGVLKQQENLTQL
jgi:hypothetical protein